MIVGDAGIGKSAIARTTAITANRELYQLKEDALAEIIFTYQPDKIDTASVKSIFSSLRNVIVFIDDIATLFSEEPVFQTRLVHTLKLLFENSSISVISTIDQTDFRFYVEKNPLLGKLFETVKIYEPTLKEAAKMLEAHIPRIAKSYEVNISSNISEKIIAISDRYIHAQKLPVKAISILDEVSAFVSQKECQNVTLSDIKIVVSERTGIPMNEINVSDKQKLQNLESLLIEHVKGQDHAIKRLSRIIRRSRAGIKDPKRPIGSFLFLGPSGVGKTFLAKSLARVVYDDENALVRIDMSEFGEAHNAQRLLGAPPGYVGYEEGGQLTNPIWERPYSLILLDEIEKAHPRVFDIFLQVIDEGRLTDGQGRTIDFNNTIIIATSNIGIEKIIKQYNDQGNKILESEFVKKTMMPLLLTYFRPEFINRFDDIVVFKPLTPEDLKPIAEKAIEELNERLADRDIAIVPKQETLGDVAQSSYDPKFGARPLKRAIREQVEDHIAHKLIFGEIDDGDRLEW